MAVISLMLTCIFYISPEYRGSIITLVILLFVFMGGVAGYISARFYKMFNVKLRFNINRKQNG